MRRILEAVTVPEDVVWELFGGTCPVTVAAELDPRFVRIARERLAVTQPSLFTHPTVLRAEQGSLFG